jgi:hypothetical protein
MASTREILEKPAAKAIIAVVVVAAIGGLAHEVSTSPGFNSNDYGKQVSATQAASQAQQAIAALKATRVFRNLSSNRRSNTFRAKSMPQTAKRPRQAVRRPPNPGGQVSFAFWSPASAATLP